MVKRATIDGIFAHRARRGRGLRRATWFILLWLAGVLATGMLAFIFKILMLEAVKQ